MVGSDASGARSDRVEIVLIMPGLPTAPREGDDVKICVDEVGTGVGYFVWSSYVSRLRFRGRGRAGDENGSNAGKSDDGGFLLAAACSPASSRTFVGDAIVGSGQYIGIDGILL